MSSKHFSNIIIGAGINGCGVFRDLALHQEEVLLIEKGDFCQQTSAHSSKLLHGGIRYLEQMDFQLIAQALQEKNIWLKLTPHLCYESPFLYPLIKDASPNYFTMKLGLCFYDLLSFYQNTSHQMLNQKQTLQKVPQLNDKLITGAGLYYDGIMQDRNIALACLQDALRFEKAQAWNHSEILEVQRKNDLFLLQIKRDEQILNLSCDQLIFTTGPFTDQLLPKIGIDWQPQLILSKGSHLWFDHQDLPISTPLVMRDEKKRVLFVIPHQQKILVGTTEQPVSKDLFNPKISAEETEYLISQLNRYFPKLNLNVNHIHSSYSGIRPLVQDESQELGQVSRHHRVYQPHPHCWVLLGGKYTTFRLMAQDIVRSIRSEKSLHYNPTLTLNPLLCNT